MAMLPEYYPGLPEDPYMEYLRKLGQFQRSSSGSGQNPSFPASSYSPNALDYLDQLDQARLQQAMMPNLPETLGSDPASMIERQFRQYQEKRQREAIPTNRSAETRGARPPANYDPLSSVQTRPRPVQPITPPSMGPPPSTGNVRLPVRTQTSETQSQSAPAQGGGLLDIEDAPESGSSWYDDPMRMGLLQAGLGLMSAPRYSTNPNDVTLSSALARGLGGFVQGYGGTKQRLSEAERQKLEDEYRKSERDFNKMYKEVMMDDAKSRIDERRGNYSATVREKLEEKNLIDTMVNEVLAAEGKIDNKTRKINLTTLARQDRDRFNELHQNATTDRTPFEQILIESGEYDAESAAGLPLSILKDTAKTIAAQRIKPEKPEGGLFGDSLQAKAAQYLIDEQGADPQQLAERIMEGRSTPQVVSVPVDPNDPTKGSRLMLLDRNNLAMDEIPGGTTVPPKKEINATDIRNYNDYQITLNQIDQSIGLLKDEEAIKGVGTIQGYYPGIAIPAKAKQLRALMADLTSDRLNEKFGAALTKQEFDRIKAAVPLETDTEETLQVKLNTLKDIFQNKLGLLEQQYPSSRYRPFPNINAVGLDGYNEAIGN